MNANEAISNAIRELDTEEIDELITLSAFLYKIYQLGQHDMYKMLKEKFCPKEFPNAIEYKKQEIELNDFLDKIRIEPQGTEPTQ